jgi:hypothetical protein
MKSFTERFQVGQVVMWKERGSRNFKIRKVSDRQLVLQSENWHLDAKKDEDMFTGMTWTLNLAQFSKNNLFVNNIEYFKDRLKEMTEEREKSQKHIAALDEEIKKIEAWLRNPVLNKLEK